MNPEERINFTRRDYGPSSKKEKDKRFKEAVNKRANLGGHKAHGKTLRLKLTGGQVIQIKVPVKSNNTPIKW